MAFIPLRLELFNQEENQPSEHHEKKSKNEKMKKSEKQKRSFGTF